MGTPCYKAVHGLDGPPPFCPNAKTLRDGLGHTAEVHDDRLGGDFILSATPLAGSPGRPAGTVHVARDITARKRAEEALLHSEEEARAQAVQLEAILSCVAEGVIVYDREGRTIRSTPAADRIPRRARLRASRSGPGSGHDPVRDPVGGRTPAGTRGDGGRPRRRARGDRPRRDPAQSAAGRATRDGSA